MPDVKPVVRALFQSVDALTRAVDAKDHYTSGHQSSVSRLARRIAQRLGLDGDRIEGIRIGAVLHDIGKLAIPAEILSSPRRLSSEEMALVRTHPLHGHQIVRDVLFPWPVAPIVAQHHERMDGTGYPAGLAGEQILLEARVVAVADVVDAIAQHRPYRPALGTDRAREELRQGRGRLYDPNVVDACLAALSETEPT